MKATGFSHDLSVTHLCPHPPAPPTRLWSSRLSANHAQTETHLCTNMSREGLDMRFDHHSCDVRKSARKHLQFFFLTFDDFEHSGNSVYLTDRIFEPPAPKKNSTP